MKKSQMFTLASSLLIIIGGSSALAEDEKEAPTFNPLETFTCNYNEGKGPADLESVIAQWSAYMDKEGSDQYFAMTMTPQYYGKDTFDIAWLGASPSGELFGQGKDNYMATGGKVGAGFASVLTCDSHSQFASMQVKKPSERVSPNNLVVAFSDCNVAEGREWDEVFAGLDAWAAYQAETGYPNGTWVLFPAYGGADADYDFKLVNSYDSHAELGKSFDLYGNGGGYVRRGEIFDDMLDCDVGRVYDGTVRRQIKEE